MLTHRCLLCAAQDIKVEQARKFEDGSVAGLLEVKYTNKAQGWCLCIGFLCLCHASLGSGLTIKDTWDTKSVIASEVSVADKFVKGSKLTVSSNFNTTGGYSMCSADFGA